MTDSKQVVSDAVDGVTEELLALSHRIHDNPETSWNEHQACAWVSDLLATRNFSVARPVAGIDTAFKATIGNGSFHVGICCEYDALPNVGHACGHNVIAAAGVGAAFALLPLLDELDLTVSVFGTPAEEGGAGKVFMLSRGVFDGVHAAMMVHPGAIERVVMPSLAVSTWQVDFFGRSAHASAAPHHGVSASSAVALAQAGIGMLREHLLSTDRVHGIVTHGGDAPNIVPKHTRSDFYIRAADAVRLNELEHKVIDVFKGAALMTGCRLELTQSSPRMTEIRSNKEMVDMWTGNAARFGREVLPVSASDGAASTDMGNVSYAMPSMHPYLAIESNGASIHAPAFAQAARSASADQTLLYGAKAMAMTVVDMATSSFRDGLTPFDSTSVSPEDATLYLGHDTDTAIRFP